MTFHNTSRRLPKFANQYHFAVRGLVVSVLVTLISMVSPQFGIGEDDVLMKALQDELNRSMTLRLGDLETPYFIQYAVDDTTSYRLSAAYGSLISSAKSNSRTLYAQVRVGSYDLDNSNFIGRGGFGGLRGVGGSVELPLESDYMSLRHAIWMATDSLYKSSVATFGQKKAYLRDRNVGERPRDFVKIDSPATSLQAPVQVPKFDSAWEEYVRNISKPFETVASLQRVGRDKMRIFLYFCGLNLYKEGDDGWAGRIRRGFDGRNHAC